MPLTMGIDVGSRNSKLVLYDGLKHDIVYSDFCDSGFNPAQTVIQLMNKALSNPHINNQKQFVTFSTGYGRNLVTYYKTVSEISCHALGVKHFLPQTQTIIDIGGQDCKVITLDEHGKIKDFAMNDKCAAGTGRFLEMVALRLDIPCSGLSELAAKSQSDINLSSTCVVFAESEIVGLIANGIKPGDIARAVHLSIADRVIAQVNQLNWKAPVVFTGGVANNQNLRSILAEKLQSEIQTPANPDITGALGAAILASKHHA